MSARAGWLMTGCLVAVFGGLRRRRGRAKRAGAARARSSNCRRSRTCRRRANGRCSAPTRRPAAIVVAPEAPPPIVESASLPFELTGIALGDDVRIAILHNKTTNEELRAARGRQARRLEARAGGRPLHPVARRRPARAGLAGQQCQAARYRGTAGRRRRGKYRRRDAGRRGRPGGGAERAAGGAGAGSAADAAAGRPPSPPPAGAAARRHLGCGRSRDGSCAAIN